MLLCSVRYSGPSPQIISRSEAWRAPGRRQLVLLIALCSSSAHQLLDLLSVQVLPYFGRSVPVPPSVMLCRGSSGSNSPLPVKPRQVGLHGGGAERGRYAKRTRKRPAPLSQFEAGKTRMEVSTPTGQPCLVIGHEIVPGYHQAKQAGLGGAFPAANARTNGRLLGSRGHSSSSLPVRKARGKYRYSAGSGAGSAGWASERISIRHPVSLAASRAFCPSLPIASDS
jgi:hypothetical protein